MEEEFVINLKVDDVKYPLKIKRSEEEVYRRAAAEVDYKLNQYKSHFNVNSNQDEIHSSKIYMAMTAIHAVANKEQFVLKAETLEDGLRRQIAELDEYLNTRIR